MNMTLRLPDVLASRLRVRAAESHRSVHGEVLQALAEHLGIMEDAPKVRKAANPPPEPKAPEHDTEGCRLYGCFQCQAAGVKDSRRGL